MRLVELVGVAGTMESPAKAGGGVYQQLERLLI